MEFILALKRNGGRREVGGFLLEALAVSRSVFRVQRSALQLQLHYSISTPTNCHFACTDRSVGEAGG